MALDTRTTQHDAVLTIMRARLRDSGMSMRQLAARSGMERHYLARRLNGKVPFGWEDLARVAPVLGTTQADILEASAALLRGIARGQHGTLITDEEEGER